jgi:glycosyltransferase involved in cell wall biosynthesis
MPMRLIAVNDKLEQVGPQMILHVGRMVTSERYKGQEGLLRGFPEIKAHFPAAQVVFAGHGDDMPRLLAIAKSFPDAVQADIFMPGYVQDDGLGQLYRDCYLFAMPSTGEGFGLVFLEAMSRAKPCLGGRVAATPCVVRDGATGLLVDDPKSSNQVAATVCWLLNHPVEANTMGRAGYNLVRSCYLYEHFRERFWKAVTAA